MYCPICTELGKRQLHKEPIAISKFRENRRTKGCTFLIGVHETASLTWNRVPYLKVKNASPQSLCYVHHGIPPHAIFLLFAMFSRCIRVFLISRHI